jgi:hypothetical protein
MRPPRLIKLSELISYLHRTLSVRFRCPLTPGDVAVALHQFTGRGRVAGIPAVDAVAERDWAKWVVSGAAEVGGRDREVNVARPAQRKR